MTRKLVSFRLADDLVLALKERATTEGIPTTELVNRLLRQGLSEQDVSLATETRLVVLEEAIQQISRRLGLENTLHIPQTEPRRDVEKKLVHMEEQLGQISAGVEESRQNLKLLAQVVAEKQDSATDRVKPEDWADRQGQVAYQAHQFRDTVPISIEDLRKLLKSNE